MQPANKLTQEEALSRIHAAHGDTYNTKDVVYRGNKVHVIMRCKIHGEFSIAPSRLFVGKGCGKCGKEEGKNKRTRTSQQFISAAKEIHGEKYDYSLTNYLNYTTNVKIICSKHGEFTQSPGSHLSRKAGCPKCGREAMSIRHQGSVNPAYKPNTEHNLRLSDKYRGALKRTLKELGSKKNTYTERLLGYSQKDLQKHLESFESFDITKAFHVDHIIPVHFFVKKGISDLRLINGLWNLQPLDPTKNLQKSGKICPLLEHQFDEIIVHVTNLSASPNLPDLAKRRWGLPYTLK
jgi:ssDNA-binding Zn-finger/Zn-ribbon topoisomerase 1